ncbi:MAG: RecQ family zinc-binding domain-containing protein, partial [Gemmatimonadetes bacterium]|nr:RecQ family zinc-binding domain-containing protein [Gemmatimonadota bacterium]
IAAAHAERRVVVRVWRALREAADATGRVSFDVDTLVARLPPSLGERPIGAALRVLEASALCTVTPPALGRVWVRLLATPARIRRELIGVRTPERRLLRAFWRLAGHQVETGAVFDLSDLPSVHGGPMGIVPLLERLAAQQFVTWVKRGAELRLDSRRMTEPVPPVDWLALDRRRRAEIRRLDAMQGYAQTRHCRRAFVLRYFGDPDARPRCGACDRCLGTT